MQHAVQDRIPRHHAPLVENLEGRRLFAVAIALAAPDMLTFVGNNAADTINIQDNGAGTIQGSATNGAGVVTPFGPFFNIRRVVVQSGGNDDNVSYQFTGDLLGGASAKRRISVDLGQGEDVFRLDASADVDLGKHARLDVNVHGGVDDGRDDLGVNYRGEMDGGWRLTMNGGDGNDRVRAETLFDTGSAGKFGARLIGGNHDDTIDLLVRKAATADPITIKALASGGNNFDTVTRTNLASNDLTCEIVNIVP